MIDYKGQKVKVGKIEFYLDNRFIEMVASESEILIIDGSNYLFRFNFDFAFDGSINIKKAFLASLRGIFYESKKQYLYVYEIDRGFYVLNKNLEELEFLPLQPNGLISKF